MKTLAHLATIGLLAGLQIISPKTARADEDDRRPIQAQSAFAIAAGNSGTRVTMFTVPKGKELVIEYLACSATVPAGQTVFPNVQTTGGGVFAGFGFLPVEQPNAFPSGSGVALLVFSQQVRIFADPGTTVALEVENSSSQQSGENGACSFAGQLSRDE